MEKKSTKKIIVGLIILAALMASFLLCYNKFAAKGTDGEKAIVIEVVDSNGTSSEYDFNTDAEYLKDAMDELADSDKNFSYSGQEGNYGLMVEVVNGEQAIYELDNAYWALYVNGEYGQYGVTEQPVVDGDTYSLRYESAE